MAIKYLLLCAVIVLCTVGACAAATIPASDTGAGARGLLETFLEWIFGIKPEDYTDNSSTKETTPEETSVTSFLETIIETFFGIKKGKKRNMQEALTNYVDLILPKDDIDTDLMKELFMIYSENDDTNFSSNFIGLEESM